MQVPRIDPTTFRLIAPSTAPGIAGFAPGDRFTARVVERLAGGDVRLDLGARQLVARSGVPLAPGQDLDLEVVRTTPVLELRLLGGTAHFSERRFAEAVLALARQDAPAESALGLARAVAALSGERLPSPLDEVVFQVVSRAGPVDATAGSGALADAVRRHLEQGGLFFETRLRVWLDATMAAGLPPRGVTPLPASMLGDLKVLLAALGRSLRAPASRTTALAGRNAPTDALLPGVLEQLAGEHGRLVEYLLARQVDVAHQWVRDGVLRFDLPLAMPWGTTMASLAIRGDARPSGRDGGGASYAIELTLSLGPMGRLAAAARWHDDQLSLRLVVEQEGARAVVEPLVPGLVDGLRQAGFAGVTSALDVDATWFVPSDTPPDALPPGGAVFSARV